MLDTNLPKELRVRNSSAILNYIRRFSATEKAVFAALVIIAGISALAMAGRANDSLKVEIPGNDGVLSEGLVGLPRTVNPVLAVTDVDRDLSALIYSGLMKYENGKLTPDLAQSVAISSDGLVYTFTLRPTATFQDGTAVTAEDVAYTIQKIQDPALKSPRHADWQDVSVSVISPSQIRFTLKQPYAPFISNTTVGIIPKHLWNNLSNDQFILSKYNIEPIGSGPYRQGSIGRDGSGVPNTYAVETWSGYYGARPHLKSINFSFFADGEKVLSALDAGSIDSAPSILPAAAARLATDSAQAYTILSSPLPRIFGVFFNQGQSPVLAERSARLALDMTAPRDAIVKTALNGYGATLNGPLPVGTSASQSSAGIPSNLSLTVSKGLPSASSTPLARAQALLEKSGWRKNSSTGIYELMKKGAKAPLVLSFNIYTADTPDLKQSADLLKTAWTALGAQVSVKVFEPSDLYQNVIRPRKYDALFFGEFIGQDRDLYAFWHSSQRNAPGLNVAMYANSQVDKLLTDIRTTIDDTVRAGKYGDFTSAITADVPAIFLYAPDFIYAVPKNLHGVDLTGMATPADRFESVTDWYSTTEKVWSIFSHSQ